MTYNIGDIIRDSKGSIQITHIRQVTVKTFTENLYTGNVLLGNGKLSKGYKKSRIIYQENIITTKHEN